MKFTIPSKEDKRAFLQVRIFTIIITAAIIIITVFKIF